MCMAPKIEAPAAPIVPESVKRVAKDQRRIVADNNAASAQAQTATNKTGTGLAQATAPGQKKSLLGA